MRVDGKCPCGSLEYEAEVDPTYAIAPIAKCWPGPPSERRFLLPVRFAS
jgi:hypothetical protein